MHYTYIACIPIDSVMKTQLSKFINTELKSDSNSDLDSEKIGANVDNKLMAKLESGSDSE